MKRIFKHNDYNQQDFWIEFKYFRHEGKRNRSYPDKRGSFLFDIYKFLTCAKKDTDMCLFVALADKEYARHFSDRYNGLFGNKSTDKEFNITTRFLEEVETTKTAKKRLVDFK